MKDPRLKFKYAKGLGDFIASILHSKLLGKITYLITGKTEPCKVCSERANALNILFPIPFWKFYFKTFDDYIKSLNEEMVKYGYSVRKVKKPVNTQIEKKINPPKHEQLNDYNLISSTDNNLGEYLVRVQTFKLK